MCSGANLLAVNAEGNMPYDICEDEYTLSYIESEMAKRGITQEQIDEMRGERERQTLNELKQWIADGGDADVIVDPRSGASMVSLAARALSLLSMSRAGFCAMINLCCKCHFVLAVSWKMCLSHS